MLVDEHLALSKNPVCYELILRAARRQCPPPPRPPTVPGQAQLEIMSTKVRSFMELFSISAQHVLLMLLVGGKLQQTDSGCLLAAHSQPAF